MNYYSALILLFGGLGSTVLGIYFLMNLKKQEKLQKIAQMDFKEQHKKILQRIPFYKKLNAQEKEKIQRSIIMFIHTKEFIGVDLDVSDEMKVVIAFYACLLLLHIDTTNCYDNLKTIIIYPHAVVDKSIKESGGIYTKEEFLIDGQSANDTVVIVWHEARSEAFHLRHNNVLIHEFAHEIDFMDGEIDGIPPIERSKYNEWIHILTKEFNALNKVALKNRDWGKYKLLGSYAASNEAEFFAVLSERFFESPKSLKKHFPQLYDELKSFYNFDTVKLV